MGADTAISWTHPPGFKGATWNAVVGCRRVSPGCEHCYAESMAGRLARMGQPRYLDVVKRDDKGQPRGRWNGTFREVPEVLDVPMRTKSPTCYFVNSMSDLFGEGVSDEWIAAVFGVMAACPWHRFQILTKRAERMAAWFGVFGMEKWAVAATAEALERSGRTWRDRPWVGWPLPNVHVGVSVEDQQRADERIPFLVRVPAAVRFLSVEPLLGPMDLRRWLKCASCNGSGDYQEAHEAFAVETLSCPDCEGRGRLLDWTIVGGESGPNYRPCVVADIESVVAQCRAAGIPCFVKQDSGPKPGRQGCLSGEVWRVKEWPEVRQ